MHEVLVNRLGDLSLPMNSVVRLIDRLDMTLDVYRGRKTTVQQQFFLGTQERVRNCRGKRAIGVRAIEVLLYFRTYERREDKYQSAHLQFHHSLLFHIQNMPQRAHGIKILSY